MKNIPLIIPCFNQLTYLKNLINWWKWYHPENPIFVLDNGSDYAPLKHYIYKELVIDKSFALGYISHYEENNFIPNLTDFLARNEFEYYVISDPDIMPHPNTPMNFLEVWKNYIDNHNFHRAGFNLITSDLPEYLNERAMIIGNEKELLSTPVVSYGNFTGYKAPLDTTFCLYKTANGGWSAPMDGKNWGNCLRLFDAWHLGWFIDGDKLNPEMQHYFETAKYRVPGEPSAGKNNNRPKQYIKE